MQDEPITFRQLAEEAGTSMRQLSIKYGIPRRTYESWSSNVRKPPQYVMNMMRRLIEIDYPKQTKE